MLFDWIAAARPKTLGAAIAPVVVGSVLGWKISGHWSTWLLLCTLGSTIALQVATNWFNDALDFMKGADTQARVGPRRITAAGVMSPKAVMTAAWLMLGVAALLSLPLIQARGWAIVAIGIPSLYFCYGYTGGPM
ncbi:MAG TPA: 1,4-dihydroxy-2-naphthoate octaprenyltransferase, partial [Verrucomicrobiales bacterium]|nr:1,4-dihydroxy-2-naphthoate octaprenyltransferase [Verrucomicrobiales bacterium]